VPGFYVLAVAAVAYVCALAKLLGKAIRHRRRLRQALGAPWPVGIDHGSLGLLPMLQRQLRRVHRLLFAYGRRGSIYQRFGEVHEKFLTPRWRISGLPWAR